MRNKYLVTWVLPDAKTVTKTIEADGFVILPNGVAMFVRELAVMTINITAQQQQQPSHEYIASAAGFNSIELK